MTAGLHFYVAPGSFRNGRAPYHSGATPLARRRLLREGRGRRDLRLVFDLSLRLHARVFIHAGIGLEPAAQTGNNLRVAFGDTVAISSASESGTASDHVPNFCGSYWHDYPARLDLGRINHLRRPLRS